MAIYKCSPVLVGSGGLLWKYSFIIWNWNCCTISLVIKLFCSHCISYYVHKYSQFKNTKSRQAKMQTQRWRRNTGLIQGFLVSVSVQILTPPLHSDVRLILHSSPLIFSPSHRRPLFSDLNTFTTHVSLFLFFAIVFLKQSDCIS